MGVFANHEHNGHQLTNQNGTLTETWAVLSGALGGRVFAKWAKKSEPRLIFGSC